jgi:SPP1 family phage portal protein
MFGRTVIYSSVDEITDYNVISVLKYAVEIHETNKSEIDYLYNYYKGRQPILSRVKAVRPEINNKIVENHAYEIVEFKKGHVFGEPIQYVQRGKDQSVSEQIQMINDYMALENKPEIDKSLAEWMNICGRSYRKTLAARTEFDNPFEIESLDPRNTDVVYSNGFKKKPLMSFQEVKMPNDKILYSIYTPSMYYDVVDFKIIKKEPHILGTIPVIEYPANNSRLGAFEVVLGLLDALNTTTSNRLDGIEQFIQSFIKFVNCDIDATTFAALKELGAIKIASKDGNQADVDIITSELNQSQVQVNADNLYQTLLIVCGMPDRNGASKTTGDTGRAVSLRDGWESAEARARDTETIFKKSEMQFLKLVLRILKDRGYTIKPQDIDVKFARNKTDNIVTKTQALYQMLDSGINPLVAISVCGLFSDPQKVYDDSEQTLSKWYIKEDKADDTGRDISTGG